MGETSVQSSSSTLANALPVRIGSVSNAAGSYLDGEVFAAAVFREALSADDIWTLHNELLGTPLTGESITHRIVIPITIGPITVTTITVQKPIIRS